jgi:transcriptional regulator with XRE-family HTH domain
MGAMVNERLRRAMLRAGLDVAALAQQIGASTKSVERWLAGTHVPYPKTRYQIAALLGEDESYFWPSAANHGALSGIELVATYPRRTDVPHELWDELLQQSARSVDVLVFAGLFLTEEHPAWVPTLKAKAKSATRLRLLLGDRQGKQLAARDEEHLINGGVGGRVTSVLTYYQELRDHIRLHDTPLYNSIYRFDDDMLVNVHVYGILAAYTPCLHLKRVDGGYFNTYLESFERVWASSRPWSD